MSDIQALPSIEHSIDVLERGIVSASNTAISLLGLDILSIRQVKIVTTLETWLSCPELLW